jgi:hypothetical protein
MGALSGAGSGAILGSVIPGIGTAIGAAAGAVIGTVASLWGELDGSNQRRRETEEAVRRMKLRQEQYFGNAVARSAASGVEFDSSTIQTYLTGMADEFRRESEWAMKNGMRIADAESTTAWLGAGAGLAKAGADFAQSQNWFQSPSLDGLSGGTTPAFGEFNLKPPDLSQFKLTGWP